MLKPKNDYRWSEMVKKAESDEAFRQHLIAAPREMIREHRIEIADSIELEVIEGLIAVIPFPDDIEISQPIDDVYTKIIQRSYSDLEKKLLNEPLMFNLSDVQYSQILQNSGLSVEGILISGYDIENGYFSFVEDTTNLKHFVLPSRSRTFDVTE